MNSFIPAVNKKNLSNFKTSKNSGTLTKILLCKKSQIHWESFTKSTTHGKNHSKNKQNHKKPPTNTHTKKNKQKTPFLIAKSQTRKLYVNTNIHFENTHRI